MLTRREFLKAACLLPFLAVALSAQPAPVKAAPETTPTEAQSWQFPLAFPAYFVKERPAQPDKKTHKVHLPLGV